MKQLSMERSYLPGLSWGFSLPEPVYAEEIACAAAARWPNKIAIEFLEYQCNFKDLYEYCRRLAKGLQRLGVTLDSNVGVCLPNSPHYPIGLLGALMAGARVVNFSPLTAPREFEHQAGDAEISTLIYLATPAIDAIALKLLQMGIVKNIVTCHLDDFFTLCRDRNVAENSLPLVQLTSPIAFSTLLANDGEYEVPKRRSPRQQVALIQYTGGTTGEPKGAMLTHANLYSAAVIMNHYSTHYIDCGAEKGLVVLPLFHIFGVCMLLAAFEQGKSCVYHLRFDPKTTLDDIQKKKIVSMAAVPTMYEALLRHPHFGEFDLSTLRRAYVGGAALSAKTRKEFKDRTGLDLIEGYGLTETTAIGSSQVLAAHPIHSTVGLAQPHLLIEIVDAETDEVLPDGSVGEICISGPTVMAGYWKNPEATAIACRGGRFHTGDIGSIDTHGNLAILDRMKDMIVNGGFKVFPINVERAIATHPFIQEVAVIGVADALHGQAVKAFVVPYKEEQKISLVQLRAYLADKLSAYECPSQLEYIQSLPKTAVGKVAKSQLG